MTQQDIAQRDSEKPIVGEGRAASPEERALIVRDERFCRTEKPSRWWAGGDPVATAWYNSVSASLPRGEAFFIETLKTFRDDMPRHLEDEIKAFVRQEINHTREHVAFNRLTEGHGYDIASIDKGIGEMLALTVGRPKEFNLAITLALEHFAACISDRLLRHPHYLADAEQEPADLWRWHATEEIEHKGLVFDVWMHATRDWTNYRRWKVRALLGLMITRKYFGNRIRDALHMMEQDGITGRRGRWRLYAFLWWKPGMMRRMFFDWVKILLPGFQPWKHDNSHLVRQYRGGHDLGAVPAE
jgi:predicted metal-dependent hydrolase